MLSSHVLKNGLRAALSSKKPVVGAIIARSAHHGVVDYELEKIGNREVVGYGFNGDPNYVDRHDFPFPAIRFKPNDAIQALKEKEKGDWKKLTKEEKKALYRASFRQTFAEIQAPTGEWKSVVGCSLIFMSLGLWMCYFIKAVGFGPDFPRSFREDARSAQLQRLLDMEYDIIEGLSSNYDYEKEEWKK